MSRWRKSLFDLVEKKRRKTTLWNQEIICLVDTLDGRAAVEQNHTDLSFHHDRKLHYPPPTLSNLEVFPFLHCSCCPVLFYCVRSCCFFFLGTMSQCHNQEYRVHYNLVNSKMLFTLLGKTLFLFKPSPAIGVSN